MEKHTLKTQERKIFGRKVKNLRRDGILPANVFGTKIKSFSIQVKQDDFLRIYKEIGETGLIDLKLDSKTYPVLVQNVQLDPVSDKPVHVDFRKVSLTEKVTAQVPIELSGEAPAEEQKIGILVTQINEIEVEALPSDLPEKIVVDVSTLSEVDQSITVKELNVDRSKVVLKADEGLIVVKIEPPAREEVVPVAAKKDEEIVAPVEGEETPSTDEGEEKTQESQSES